MPSTANLEPLADRVHALREELTREIVEEHYRRHPDWWERWGEHGHEQTTRDTAYHLEFLEAALRNDLDEVFAWYSAWLASVLRARGVPVAAIREAYELLDAGLSQRLPAPEITRVRRAIDAGVQALDGEPDPVPGAPSTDGSPSGSTEHCEALTRALLAGSRKDAHRVLRTALDDGLSYHDLADGVVQPAMTEVGRLWQTNRITVAQEHLATATLQTALALLLSDASFQPAHGRLVTLACVEENDHAMGLRALADVFELAGWDVMYLGANVPTRDLLAHLRETHPDVLCLSLALPRHVAAARRAIDAIRESLGEDAPRILVGGLPVREFPGLLHVVGADDVASGAAGALHAVES